MKYRLSCLLVAVCMNATVASSASLPSVISINLCTDQMVMLLADPSQIRALSSLSQDEAGSYYRVKAKEFAQAEPIPDLSTHFALTCTVRRPQSNRSLKSVPLSRRKS